MDNIVTDLGRRRFAIGFLGLTAAFLIPGARGSRAASLPAPPGPMARKFNVFWDNDAIGHHQIKITPGDTPEIWDVQVDIDLEIDLGLFGTVAYRYAGRERWQDGRIVALEILIATPGVRNLIREGKSHQIPSMIQTGKKYGMTLLDDSIMDLFKRGAISAEEGYAKSNDKARFRPLLRSAPADFTEA